MTVLLVDDGDGWILSEVESIEDAQGVLEAWARADGSVPDYICIVEFRSHHGALLGTDTSTKIRPLRE